MPLFFLIDYIHLVTWIVFVFWEPYSMREKDRVRYDEYYAKRPSLARVPKEVFAPVWFVLKSILVAAYFMYFKAVSDAYNPLDALPTLDNPVIIATMSLIIAATCLSKYWLPFYFRWKMYQTAFAISFALWGCAIVVAILMGTTRVGSLWFIPVIFVSMHAAWLTVATILNLQRVLKEKKECEEKQYHYHHPPHHSHHGQVTAGYVRV
jgi:tryptophan-rich sensory protein